MIPRFYSLCPADSNNQDVPKLDGLVGAMLYCYAAIVLSYAVVTVVGFILLFVIMAFDTLCLWCC